MATDAIFISEQDVEAALDWLRDHARTIGNAKEEAVYREHMLKHIKALEMKKHEGPVSAQEREALASADYAEALIATAKAAGQYEYQRALKEAAESKIGVFQTLSANYRSMRL